MQVLMPEALNLPRVVDISCCHSRDRGVKKKPTQVLCKPVHDITHHAVSPTQTGSVSCRSSAFKDNCCKFRVAVAVPDLEAGILKLFSLSSGSCTPSLTHPQCPLNTRGGAINVLYGLSTRSSLILSTWNSHRCLNSPDSTTKRSFFGKDGIKFYGYKQRYLEVIFISDNSLKSHTRGLG